MTATPVPSERGWSRGGLALLAATPYIALQLVFLSDTSGWSEALEYGLMFVVLPAVFVGWTLMLVLEVRKRRRFPTGRFRRPSFSLVGLGFLLTFFLFGIWMKPLVLRAPRWCQFGQDVEWKSAKQDEKYGGDHRFVLMLSGRGNEAEHTFTWACLRWSGDDHFGKTCDGFAQISYIRFNDLTFSYATNDEFAPFPATLAALRSRMRNAKISDAELDRISADLWAVLQQVERREAIAAEYGTVKRSWTTVCCNEDTVLGGLLWIALLTGAFQQIGRWTLPSG